MSGSPTEAPPTPRLAVSTGAAASAREARAAIVGLGEPLGRSAIMGLVALTSVVALTALAGGCHTASVPRDAASSDAPMAEADASATDPTRSTYTMDITTDLGQTLHLDRDVTHTAGAFAFGSTHIAPAISLAVSESLSYPATVQITLNFGILADPSGNLAVQTGAAGTFPFGGDPPEIDVSWGIPYRSAAPGAAGEVVIDTWSMTQGGVMAGRLHGRLVEQVGAGAGAHWADVEGTFHFVLPPPETGG